MAGTDQEQIGQYRYTKGFLDPSLLPTHLVCAQSQVGLEFPIDLFSVPLRRPLYTQVMRRLLR